MKKNEIPLNPRNKEVIHKYHTLQGTTEKPAACLNLGFMDDGDRNSIIYWSVFVARN